MNRPRPVLLSLAGVALLVSVACSGQTGEQAGAPPAAGTQKPAGEAAPSPAVASTEPAAAGAEDLKLRSLVAPVRGEALLGYLNPVSRRQGNMIVTTIKVKNLSKAPIAGLKVDEFWYDKAGNPVTGAQSFRHRQPLMPDEVIDVVLRVPTNPQMDTNQYKFEHANGTIKTERLQKM